MVAPAITYLQPYVNLIPGTGITITIDTGSEDGGDNEITISASGGSGDVATDAIFDAKGDLAVGTGSDTADNLAAGANDTILMADSAAATGLKWVASAAPVAVGTANAEGTSDDFSRASHVHAHEAAHINHDTTWAAKGDSIVGTANDTAAVLSVGANGTINVADSNQTTGQAWELKSAGAQTADVTTSETTTSTSFTDLATSGPAVTITVGISGMALIIVSASIFNSNAGNNTFMSYSIDGDTATTARGAVIGAISSTAGTQRMTRANVETGLSPGSHTFTSKYLTAANTGTFAARRIIAIPL